jgi:hypothetical protein
LPRVEEGWVVYEPARLRSLESLAWVVECGCVLVSEPFTAIVVDGGERLQVAIGPGSVVCPEQCGGAPEPSWRLASPAWARGVVADEGPFPYTGPADAARVLSAASGVELEDAGSERVLMEGGVAVASGGLEFEPHSRVCGELIPMNPLNPVAALAPREACLETVYEPVRGSRWWGGAPVAAVRAGRSRLTIVYSYGVVVGERPTALLYTAWPPTTLLAAYAAGVIYACGRRD